MTCLPDDDTWPKVKVLVDNLEQLWLCLLRRTISEHGDGQRLGHSDGIGHLWERHTGDKHASSSYSCTLWAHMDLKYMKLHPHLHQNSPAQFGLDQRFGHPAGSVGSGAVHLWEVFAGESSTSVSSPPSVCVDDDLPARDSGVTLVHNKKPEMSKITTYSPLWLDNERVSEASPGVLRWRSGH